MRPVQAEVPRALVDACRPLATPLEGRFVAPAQPLEESAMPRRAGASDDPALVRLRALEAVDELRARLRRDPESPALHLQLARIFSEVLENREARIQHLCRALLGAPQDPAIQETVLGAWMTPGAELELELALRPGDRSLPWRSALDAVRADQTLDERGRARAFEDALRAQRVIRNGAPLRRERVRARVDATLLTEWAALNGPGERLRLVASVRAKDRALLTRSALEPGVTVSPGFDGRQLLHGHDAAAVLTSLSAALPGRRVFLVARVGDSQLVFVGEPEKAGGLLAKAFAVEPDDGALRAVLVAGGAVRPAR